MFTVIDKLFEERESPQDRVNFLEVSHLNSAYFGQADATPRVVASKVKALLQSPKTSCDGLLLLNCFLDVLPRGLLQSDIIPWIRTAVRLLPGKKYDRGQKVAWAVVDKLLRHLVAYPELSREASDVVPTVLQKVFEQLPAETREPQEGALKCLHTCMKHYSRLLGSVQDALEKFLCQLLVSWNSASIQDLVCQCLALLPWCGRTGNQGSQQKDAWSRQMVRLLATVNLCLDSLFEDVHIEKSNISREEAVPLEAPGISSGQAAVFLSWRRVLSSSRVISFMLSTDLPRTVSVPSEDILRLLFRMLSVNTSVMYSGSTAHERIIASIMPSIQSAALELMNQLILSCRQALARDAEHISEMILQVILRSTAESSIDLRRLRQMAYKVLGLWLQVSKSGASLERVMDKLISQLLCDIQIVTDSIELSKKGGVSVPHNDALKPKDGECSEIKEALCEHALEALRRLIYVHGTLLKPDLLQEVQHSTVMLLLKVQQQWSSPPVPYGPVSCRKALYATLLSLMVNYNSSFPPPLHCCLRIFSAGIQDCSVEVVELCTHALACGSLIAQPQVASLPRQAASGHAMHCTSMSRDETTQTVGNVSSRSDSSTQTLLAPWTPFQKTHHRQRGSKMDRYSEYQDDTNSGCEDYEDGYDDDFYHEEELELDGVERRNGSCSVRSRNGTISETAMRSVHLKQAGTAKHGVKRPFERDENGAKRLHTDDADEESLEDESFGESIEEEEEGESDCEVEGMEGGMAMEMGEAGTETELIDLDNDCNDEVEEDEGENVTKGGQTEDCEVAPLAEGEAEESCRTVLKEKKSIPPSLQNSAEGLMADRPKEPASEPQKDEVCTSNTKEEDPEAVDAEAVVEEIADATNHVEDADTVIEKKSAGEEAKSKGDGGGEMESEVASLGKVKEAADGGLPTETKDSSVPDVAEMLLDFVDCSPDE